MKAIRNKFIQSTGRRLIGAGVSAKDLKASGTRSHPSWQNVDDGIEVSLITGGEMDRFDGLEGVEVLEGEATIDAAVVEIQGAHTFSVFSEKLMLETAKEKKLLGGLSGKSQSEQLKYLHDEGCAGITCDEKHPISCADMCAGHGVES